MIQLLCSRCKIVYEDSGSLDASQSGPLYQVIVLPHGWENLDGRHLCQKCYECFVEWMDLAPQVAK
jgi:hypothetical protein